MLISKSQNLWKRMRLSLSVFASLMMVASHGVASPKKGKERIAIIGSGASGITAAYLLKKQGYQNVTIFEKEDSVGGVAHTVKVDGRYYDMSTMFVPGGNIAGDGIEPLLKEMIAVSKEKLIPAVDFVPMDLPEAKLNPLTPYLQTFAPDDLSQQLIKGLSLMTKFAGCLAAGVDSVTCGISQAGNLNEGIHEWGSRNGVPAFTHLITYTADALGAGPTSYSNATAGLAGGFQWTPVEVVRILKALGVSASDLPEGTPPNILSLMAANKGQGTQRWWFFKRGYQTFWKSLVKHAGIRVKLSEPVTALNFVDSRWSVQTNKRSYKFDRVIVATTPRAAMHFLAESPQKELLSTAIVRVPPNDVYLAPINGYQATGLPSQAAWWPSDLGLGTVDLINPEVGTAIKPFFWQKRHKKDVIFIGTYTLSPELTPDQAFAVSQQFAESSLGFTVGQQIEHKRFFFPPTPEDRAVWTQGWSSLQGENGLFFIGEAFTGSGVPAIASGLQGMIPTFFE